MLKYSQSDGSKYENNLNKLKQTGFVYISSYQKAIEYNVEALGICNSWPDKTVKEK